MEPRRGAPPEQDTGFTLLIVAILLVSSIILGLLGIL